MRRYRDVIMHAPCPKDAPEGVFTAILLNFRRPQNIELLARMLLQVPLIKDVIVSNNNPTCDLSRWFHLTHPRLQMICQPVVSPCMQRYFIALETAADYFICIDDDLFLLPSQVQRLCEETLNDPSVAHGMFGQTVLPNGSFRHAVSRSEGRIDVINRCYVFARPLLERWHEILRESGLADDSEAMRMGWWDDMLLSCAGAELPLCHDVGPYVDCSTQGKQGIAVWREPEFFSSRQKLWSTLRPLHSRSSAVL